VVEATAHGKANYEPQDGFVYHCAQAEVRPISLTKLGVDWQGIEDYTETCRHRPKMIMHYISFDILGFTLLKRRIEEIANEKYDYMLQIGLDFYNYFPFHGIVNPRDITKDIADGNYDGKIRELGILFKKIAAPVFLRPGYEFGGNGQGKHASKEHWIRAWKRIHRTLRSEQVENVAFVWNTLDARDYMDYYPGDEYVDWWGINIFDNHADRDAFIRSFIQTAAKHQKPVMIAEATPRYVGSIGGEAAWKSWYQPVLNLLSKHPNIKAFCYINATWKDYPDRSFAFDCRIQSNAYVSEKYRGALSTGQFINARPKYNHQ